MRSLRRFSAVSIAFLPAVLFLSSIGVRAQSAVSPAIQPPASAHTPPFAVYISPPFSTSQSAALQQPQTTTAYRPPPLVAAQAHNPLKSFHSQKLALLAGNDRPCYTLRTYGFTTPRDTASAPHMSSYQTCTPASATHFKEVVTTPSGNK